MLKQAKQKLWLHIKTNSHKWLLAIMVLLVALGVLFTILIPSANNMSSSSSFATTNFDGSTTRFSKVRYVGPNTTIPQELPIASLTSSQNVGEQLTANLIAEYQLEPIDGVEAVWIGPTHSMSFDANSNLFTLVKNEPNISVGVIDKNLSDQAATTILTQLLPEHQAMVSLLSTQFYAGDFHLEPSTRSQATFVEYNYSPELVGYPAFSEKDSHSWVSILIGNDGELQKLDFNPNILDIAQDSNLHQTISVDEAVRNINNDEASIMTVSNFSEQIIDLEQVVSGELTQHQLEYRINAATPLVLPFYRFFGTITTADNNAMDAEILVSALKNAPQLVTETTSQP